MEGALDAHKASWASCGIPYFLKQKYNYDVAEKYQGLPSIKDIKDYER